MSTKIFLKQLKDIESLVKQKEELLEEEYYDKYHPIFEQARKFLETQDILLYGGLAINEIFPKKQRFYGEKELPDFDLFTLHAKKLANRAVAYFKKNGYPLTTASEALHENTYKVLVSGLSVLDITEVTPTMFEMLSKNKQKTRYELYTVNPQFLRMTLHQMLSQPKDSHRWIKLFKRVLTFYKVYPPHPQICKLIVESEELNRISEEDINPISEKTMKWVHNNKYVLFGPDAWMEELPKRNQIVKQLRELMDYYKTRTNILIEILVESTNLDEVIQEWFKFLNPDYSLKKRLSYSRIIENGFMSPHIYIYLDSIPIICLYHTEACVSYIQTKTSKHRIASVQTVLRMYLQKLLAEDTSGNAVHTIHYKYLECMINLLTTLSIKSITQNRHEFLKSFVLGCYGEQPGIITLKRRRYERIAKEK